MRSFSPTSISWLIAGPVSLIFLTVIIIFGLDVIQFAWPVAILIVIAVFLISFFLSFFLVKILISQKIKPIYRIIGQTKKSSVPKGKKRDQLSPIEEIYRDVDDWTRSKNSEIKKLKANAKFRQEFLGNIGHELKTPIFNIQGYLLTLLDGGLEDTDINRDYLERAEKSIDRMIQIIKDLEYIARIEAGELELDYEDFNLVELVKEVFELHEMRAKAESISLRLSPKTDKSVFVSADKKRIFEVLSNLVVNGIAYGNPDGYVVVDLIDMDRHILVEVSDNGIGIRKEEQHRIFERFYRVDKSRSREEGGTGLGLAIAKHFIEAHGHTINMKSKLGSGTSFTFMLNKN